MSKGVKVVAIVAMVLTLGVATVAAVAYAQEAATGSSPIWDYGQKVKEAVAEALGISVEKYDETVAAAQQQVLEDAVAEGQITQEEADRIQERLDEFDGLGGRHGLRPGHGEGGASVLLKVAAEKLGLTEAELRTELQSKSIAELAEEKGVDLQTISDAYLAEKKAQLDAQVADGSLTQAEADAKLQQKTEDLPDRLTGTWADLGGHGRDGGRRDVVPDTAGEDDA